MQELQEVKCKICTKRYDEGTYCPTGFDCGHTTCKSCYQEVIKVAQNLRKTPCCPFCRKLIEVQKDPVTNFALLDTVTELLIFKECPIHENMALRYLCCVDNQQICNKCLHNDGIHRDHQVKNIEEIKKEVDKNKIILEEDDIAWSQYEKKFDGLLEKRKNEQLDLAHELFDDLEATVKQRKLEIRGKIIMTYEHERNKIASVLGEKSQFRQLLKSKIREHQSHNALDLWAIYGQNIHETHLKLDPSLAEEKFKLFSLDLNQLQESFKMSLKDQRLKIACIDFSVNDATLQQNHQTLALSDEPYDSLEVSSSISKFKINTSFRFELSDSSLVIALNQESQAEPYELDPVAWQNTVHIQVNFSKLDLNENDFWVLKYVLSKINKLQIISMKQVLPKTKLKDAVSKQPQQDKIPLITLMDTLFSDQKHLTSVTLNLCEAETGYQVLRSFVTNSLPNLGSLPLKRIEISFEAFFDIKDTFNLLMDSFPKFQSSLEELKLILPQASHHPEVNQGPIVLSKLKKFELEIDCSTGREFDIGIQILLLNSLQKMTELENLNIKINNYNLHPLKWFQLMFERIEDTTTLKDLCVELLPIRDKEQGSEENHNALFKLVSSVSEPLYKMDHLSTLCLRFGQASQKMQNRQEIKNYIGLCKKNVRNNTEIKPKNNPHTIPSQNTPTTFNESPQALWPNPTNTNINTNPYANTYISPNSNTNPNPYANTYTNANTNTNTNPNPYANTYTNPNPVIYRTNPHIYPNNTNNNYY